MELKKCSHCSRAPQPIAKFINDVGKETKTCLKCRLKGKKEDSKPERRNRHDQCEQCTKVSVFNLPGTKKGRFCNEHKEDGMINIISLKCNYESCQTQPCYNFLGILYPEYCAKHKLDNMVNVRERPCEFPECLKKPNYNIPGEARGRFCKTHKEPNMVNVLSNHCQHEGCTLRASYNKVGSKKGTYCNFHKKEGMINIVSKRCEYENCSKIPVYNSPEIRTGRFCLEHKQTGMIDVLNKRCKTPMCDVVLVNGKTYCSRCFAYMFPDQPSHYKTRENSVGMFLRETFPDITLTQDKRVECHLYRPDFVIDMGSHAIVVEIDENQHKSYDTSCNNRRLMSIFEGLGSRPMVMIRFNPDGYDNVPSCWTRDHTIADEEDWNERLETLRERIVYWMDNEPERELSFEHLFFTSLVVV